MDQKVQSEAKRPMVNHIKVYGPRNQVSNLMKQTEIPAHVNGPLVQFTLYKMQSFYINIL